MQLTGLLDLGTGFSGNCLITPSRDQGYAAQLVSFESNADGVLLSQTSCIFGPTKGIWGNISHFAISDNSGKTLFAGGLIASFEPDDGELISVPAGALQITFAQTPPAPDSCSGPTGAWAKGDVMFVPAQNLPTITAVATGSSQLTAAPVPLAKILVNAGAGGGILLPSSRCWNGNTIVVWNRTGGAITVYPYAGDTIENNAVNAGVPLQDEGSAEFNVANSGLIIMS